MTARRIHRKKVKSTRRDPWSVTRTLIQHKDPKKTPTIEMLIDIPEKCPRCGCLYVRVFTEVISQFSVGMVHCPGTSGGCGRTWRLHPDSVRLLLEKEKARGRNSDG